MASQSSRSQNARHSEVKLEPAPVVLLPEVAELVALEELVVLVGSGSPASSPVPSTVFPPQPTKNTPNTSQPSCHTPTEASRIVLSIAKSELLVRKRCGGRKRVCRSGACTCRSGDLVDSRNTTWRS